MSNLQIKESFQKTDKALAALKQMIDSPMQDNRGNIDAIIHRFEFTADLFWKLLKRILESKGTEVIYPKDVLKQAYAGNLIDNETMWLNMLRDRNLTSHTYNARIQV